MVRPPVVRCRACAFEWHSAAMADGLRVLGTCPRCSGELEFLADEPQGDRFAKPAETPRETAPHLILGIPRR